MEKRRQLKALWSSNSPWSNSGYGSETRDLLKRFKEDGWDFSCSAFFGLEGHEIEWEGIKCYPKMQEPFGTDALFHHGRYMGAHVRFSMQDVGAMDSNLLSQMQNWVPYCPIDLDPIQPQILNNLRFAYKIITFSKWGHDVLQKHGFTSTFIREGVDTNIFKPLNKAECRKELGIPQDAFVVGQIGANKENPPRKAWQESLEAFKLFKEKHPEAIYFYQSNQNYPGGFPIPHFAMQQGIANSIMKLDEYQQIFHTGPVEINKMLNAFDVLIHPSMTEGFGLIVIEAQSAGCPVIINNACSMPELIVPNETSFMCESNRDFYASAGGYFKMPDVKSLYEQLEKSYSADRKKMGERAREHIIKNYNIDTIVKDQWIPLLEELQEQFAPLQDV